MKPVTLVTGGTGFIGIHVLRRLFHEDPGAAVRVLVRHPERLTEDIRGRVAIECGDLTDAGAVANAVRGAHTVLHLAALARAWARDPGAFESMNVRVVETLLRLSEWAGVERFVHVSTVLAAPPHRESAVRGSSARPTPYQSTKREGERLVARYVAAGNHAVTVRPTRVYGPGPLTDANGVSLLIERYINRWPCFRLADGDVQANYVFVEDVADGILLAARRGPAGATYFLGGENVSMRGFFEVVSEISGVRRRIAALPPWLALQVARGAVLAGRLGASPMITPGWVRTFLEDHRVDIEPARRELGYAPRPLREGVRATIEWLRGPNGSAGSAR